MAIQGGYFKPIIASTIVPLNSRIFSFDVYKTRISALLVPGWYKYLSLYGFFSPKSAPSPLISIL